jgi:hypothetical protein
VEVLPNRQFFAARPWPNPDDGTVSKKVNTQQYRRWHSCNNWYKLKLKAQQYGRVPIVKIHQFLKRLIAGDNAVDGGAVALRNVIVWLFIAMVALFLTKPDGEPRSFFDHPLPMPAELGLK